MWRILTTLPFVLLLGSGCSHDPNRGISKEQARAAARKVHPRLPPLPTGKGPGTAEPVMIPFNSKVPPPEGVPPGQQFIQVPPPAGVPPGARLFRTGPGGPTLGTTGKDELKHPK